MTNDLLDVTFYPNDESLHRGAGRLDALITLPIDALKKWGATVRVILSTVFMITTYTDTSL